MNGIGNGKGYGTTNAVTTPEKTDYFEVVVVVVVAGGGEEGDLQMESYTSINLPFLFEGVPLDQNINLDMLLDCNIEDYMR